MARDSSGTRNEPIYSSSGAPADAADLTELGAYAAAVGNRKVGTDSQRVALTGADRWVGMQFLATDTGVEWKYTATGWAVKSIKTALASVSGLGTSPTVVQTIVLPVGSWLVTAHAYFEYSTGAARAYTAELWNSTSSTQLENTPSLTNGTSGNMPIVFQDIVTVTAPTTLQLRATVSAADGTQILSRARLTAIEA